MQNTKICVIMKKEIVEVLIKRIESKISKTMLLLHTEIYKLLPRVNSVNKFETMISSFFSFCHIGDMSLPCHLTHYLFKSARMQIHTSTHSTYHIPTPLLQSLPKYSSPLLLHSNCLLSGAPSGHKTKDSSSSHHLQRLLQHLVRGWPRGIRARVRAV